MDIDLSIKELAFLNTWADRIAAKLDELGLTTDAVAQVKRFPETVKDLKDLTEEFKGMRERVNYLIKRTPTISTPDNQWDVMHVASDGTWERYTIPTEPEV